MFRRSNVLHTCIAMTLATILMLGGMVLPSSVPGAAPAALAQNYDFRISVSGPSSVAPGNNITYTFSIENLRGGEITDFSFFSKIPANTTYVSGGTYNAGENRAEFSLASLPADATETFSLVVNVGSGVAADTVIKVTGSDFDAIDWFVTGEYGGYLTSGTVDTTVTGTVVAILKHNGRAFDVEVDGFQFENYGTEYNWEDDLTTADVFNLFGPDVCKTGNTASNCVLKSAAEKWRYDTVKDMGLGHCDGMASASLSLFTQQPIKGISKPSDIQGGASNTIDLNSPPGEKIENYIAAQMSFQYTEEYWDKIITKKPSQLVSDLTAAFNSTTPVAYELTIEKQVPPAKHADGHAITAYGIEKVNDNEVRILVYDNNYPKKRNYIAVNTANETWRYETSAIPGETPDVYTGTETSKNLHLVPNSFRSYPNAQNYFECLFCYDDTERVSAQTIGTALADEKIQVQYVGEGAILVVNDEGQRTGADPVTDTFVNEIPNAQVRTHRGGLGKQVPPRIVFPVNETDDTFYTVIVHGETISNTSSGSLNLTGPGFVIGVTDIELDPGDIFEFTFSPDGDHISFDASEDLTAPEIYIAHDPVHDGDPSIIFDIEGVTLLAGEKVSLDLDPVLERIHFNHTGPEEEDFIVDMQHIWPDGDVEDYNETIELPAGDASASIDFGAWDGLEHPPIYFDDVLQNPSINHRLDLTGASTSYDSTPQPNAPAGVYTISATFTNFTEVTVEDVYFTVAELGGGNVLLNADGGPAGTGATVSVPGALLGEGEILDVNESLTFTFEIGLASQSPFNFFVDANGVPVDWQPNTEAAATDAVSSESFDLSASESDLTEESSFLYLPLLAR